MDFSHILISLPTRSSIPFEVKANFQIS